MGARSVEHGTVVVKRKLKAPVTIVFSAWAVPEKRRQWQVPGRTWELGEFHFDFKVGGEEWVRFGAPGAPQHLARTRYQDIVPERRIVMADTMNQDDQLISASLITAEFLPDGQGTTLIVTEQVAFLDGKDKPQWREQGWGEMLDKLEAALDGAAT